MSWGTQGGPWFWLAWRSNAHGCAVEFERAMRNLGRCLRDAGALCAAFELGEIVEGFWWWPGCGRSVR